MSTPAETILGMLVKDGSLLEKVTASLKPEFFDPTGKKVFQAILRAEAEGLGVNYRSVASLLPDAETKTFLAQVMASAPIAQNIEPYVQEFKAQRWSAEMMENLHSAYTRLLNRKAFESLDGVRLSISSLAQDLGDSTERKRIFTGEEVAKQVLDDVNARVTAALHGGIVGIPTGFKTLDRIIYGWEKGTLYTLGARSRIGKTTSAVNIAVTAAESGTTTAFFTVEMSAKQIGKKGSSRMGEIDFSKLMSGKIDDASMDRFHDSLQKMSQLPVVFVEASPSFETFVADVRRLKKTHGIQFVILDYIQQMYLTDKKSSGRTNDLTLITSQLKWLTRDLDIPILMLAQLNRSAEEEEGAPSLRHLKDSGSLEQDSDTVMFLWRENDGYENGAPRYTYWLDVAKNRHGMEGRIPLAADLVRNYFGEKS